MHHANMITCPLCKGVGSQEHFLCRKCKGSGVIALADSLQGNIVLNEKRSHPTE